MEPIIRERFNDEILAAARQRYAIAADQITLLDGFESFMFEFTRDGAAYILRLGHSRRRTPDLIRGEVDWINYLADGGAGVAKAVLSANGQLVELIPDGRNDHFLATAFTKAPGGPAWRMGQWDEPLFVNYGRLLGRIHRLSQSYQPANPAWQRPHWDAPLNLIAHDTLEADDTLLGQRYRDVLAYLQALPRTPNGYGMIHQDAHGGNFFVDENGRITLFDFDDCCYGHFAYDLAMVLFYAIVNRDDADTFAPAFWQPFWRGYQQENDLDPAWLAEIHPFMKLREIELYAVLMRDYGLEALSDDSWASKYLHGRLPRIEQNQPLISPTLFNL
jgi:amicoumacin kinase